MVDGLAVGVHDVKGSTAETDVLFNGAGHPTWRAFDVQFLSLK